MPTIGEYRPILNDLVFALPFLTVEQFQWLQAARGLPDDYQLNPLQQAYIEEMKPYRAGVVQLQIPQPQNTQEIKDGQIGDSGDQ